MKFGEMKSKSLIISVWLWTFMASSSAGFLKENEGGFDSQDDSYSISPRINHEDEFMKPSRNKEFDTFSPHYGLSSTYRHDGTFRSSNETNSRQMNNHRSSTSVFIVDHHQSEKNYQRESGWKEIDLYYSGSNKPHKHHTRKDKKTRRHSNGHMKSFQGSSSHRHFSQNIPKVPETPPMHFHDQEPIFDHSMPSKLDAQLGSSAFLLCKIYNLEDKTVSWIRNRDAHILTVDQYTFIADKRFSTFFDKETDTWTLQIKFTSPHDVGRYECQVSSEPKRSHFVTLSIVVPRVEIPGGPELHVRSGSDMVFKCIIYKALVPPPYVFWYHEAAHHTDGSIGDIIHQAPLSYVGKESCVANLVIKNAEQKHAGNYTCAPAGLARSASVLLHILNEEEHPAAMQHNDGSNKGTSFHQRHLIILVPALFTLFSTNFSLNKL